MINTFRGGRSVVGSPILTLADADRKLERAAHVALTVLGHVMHTDPQDTTRVQAAGIILKAHARSRAQEVG